MKLEKENNEVTFIFEEDLIKQNIASFPAFDEKIKGCSCIVLNFQGVNDIDRSGVHLLIYLYLFSQQNNNTNYLENAGPKMKETLSLLSVDKLFPIF